MGRQNVKVFCSFLAPNISANATAHKRVNVFVAAVTIVAM
jgi:hypothetical protein